MPRQILIKLSKIKYKEKILKAAREKQEINLWRFPCVLTADLSAETLQARREWQDIFKMRKEKHLQPRLLHTPAHPPPVCRLHTPAHPQPVCRPHTGK